MKRILLTIVLTILATLIVAVAGWVVFLYSGAYNISTYNHDNGVVNWALDRGMTRSVIRHAKEITTPLLTDPAMVQKGFEHYHEMCVACHGAPGVAPEEIARGLWPEAPNLSRAVPDWTPAQLFWITRNGIKFSAMPAWGPTHSDDEIWAMVAFLEKLPRLSAADYQEMKQKLKGGAEQHQHEHGTPGGHEHSEEGGHGKT